MYMCMNFVGYTQLRLTTDNFGPKMSAYLDPLIDASNYN